VNYFIPRVLARVSKFAIDCVTTGINKSTSQCAMSSTMTKANNLALNRNIMTIANALPFNRNKIIQLLITLSCVLLLTGCSGDWGWYVVDPTTPKGQTNLKFLLSGIYYTIALSVTAIVISIFVGLLVALPALSSNPFLKGFNRVYVEIVRAIPILVMILWVYYGMPQLLGLTVTVFWAGVIALALSDSAFEAEIFRAGIQSIDKGQYEASHTVALSYSDTMRYVILPQAIRRILPALGNQLVYMLKMSSLVSVIGMQELTRKANELVVTEYRPLEIYTILLLEYLVLILIVSAGVRWLERRLAN